MTILEFVRNLLGIQHADFIIYIISGSLLLVLLDGILGFLLGGISSLTMRR